MEVALGQAPVLVVHPAVQVVLQVVPETEDENAVAAKVLMPRGGMKIKKKKETKKEKGRGIEIGIENEIERKKRKKGAIRFLTNLNPKDVPGIHCIYS